MTSARQLGWSLQAGAAFFHAPARDPQGNRPSVAAILIAGLAAVTGLAAINLRTDFSSLGATSRACAYWLANVGALAYWIWICWLYWRSEKS